MSIREKTAPARIAWAMAVGLALALPSAAYAGNETEITLQRILAPEHVDVPRPGGPELGPFAPGGVDEDEREGDDGASAPADGDANANAGASADAERNPRDAAGLAKAGDSTPEAVILCAGALACAAAAAAARSTRTTNSDALPRSER